MATIKIHIDSESHEIDGNDKHVRVLAAVDKVGLISSVPVSTEMREAFNDGLGQRKETGEKEFADEEPGIGYKAQPIKDAKDRLKGKNCKVIATAGGDGRLLRLERRKRSPHAAVCLSRRSCARCLGPVRRRRIARKRGLEPIKTIIPREQWAHKG